MEAKAADGGQAERWNGPSGNAWVEAQELLDGLYRPFADLLVETVPEGGADRVLDVGCGTGGTTVAVARRLGPRGRCVGVDVSAPMLDAARARVTREAPGPEGDRVSFVRGDAQVHAFEPGSFDRVLSRFGVMFFDDPGQALANLRRAARNGARLRFVTWRGMEENPFMTVAERAAAPLLPGLPERRPDTPGQFAFADPVRVRRLLEEAGWENVALHPVETDCVLPADRLVWWAGHFGPVGAALHGVDEPTRERVMAAVLPVFDPFVHGDEVRFTAACWRVDATATGDGGPSGRTAPDAARERDGG
ncbi:class I SAM-dependent methyltransferase [Streptomyces sp. NPDC048566]|uniref:class I SAM-dependent methyltransferase n=1 Tax=Streptomyces sp. NPDC048566 TaxID=3365569 RepID=UPI00371A50E3